VFDPDLNPIRQIANVRAPWAVCITPPPNQYLYSADGPSGKIYERSGQRGQRVRRIGQPVHRLEGQASSLLGGPRDNDESRNPANHPALNAALHGERGHVDSLPELLKFGQL
jgi:hypothetical protein